MSIILILGWTISFAELPVKPIKPQDVSPQQLKKGLPSKIKKLPQQGFQVDKSEPNNNNINGADLINLPPLGSYYGVVGGADPADYIRICTPSGGFGQFVKIKIDTLDAYLSLFGPRKTYLEGNADQVWIAVKPGICFYISVTPVTSSETTYNLTIESRTINDPAEPNDSCNQSRNSDIGDFEGHLVNVMDQNEQSVGINDYYGIMLRNPEKIKIEVQNAGLPLDDHVLIYLYDPSCWLVAHHEGNPGTNNFATMVVDLRDMYRDYRFPSGYWKIQVTNYVAGASGYPSPYGKGEPPQGYTRKYRLLVTQVR